MRAKHSSLAPQSLGLFSSRRFARDFPLRKHPASDPVPPAPTMPPKVLSDSADTRTERVSNAAGVP